MTKWKRKRGCEKKVRKRKEEGEKEANRAAGWLLSRILAVGIPKP